MLPVMLVVYQGNLRPVACGLSIRAGDLYQAPLAFERASKRSRSFVGLALQGDLDFVQRVHDGFHGVLQAVVADVIAGELDLKRGEVFA